MSDRHHGLNLERTPLTHPAMLAAAATLEGVRIGAKDLEGQLW